MGIVYTNITLKNVKDIHRAEEGLIGKMEIRQTAVEAVVDTGAITLVINEDICSRLGLELKGERHVTLANDAKQIVKVASPVEVHWKNRTMTCQPLVASRSGRILLGAIPLEEMDLIVDPVRQELTGAHGDEIISILV